MIDLRIKYLDLKKEANLLMKQGKVSAYLETLLEMKKHKKIMFAVIAN